MSTQTFLGDFPMITKSRENWQKNKITETKGPYPGNMDFKPQKEEEKSQVLVLAPSTVDHEACTNYLQDVIEDSIWSR